ncbi:MAG: type II toxin-antitoxin system VapC family toxin [Hyphomicrobiales bacterium]
MKRLTHEQIYLDTNIFIAAIEAFNSVALELFQMAEKGLVFLVTSEVTRGELLVKPLMANDTQLPQRYEALFDNPQMLNAVVADRDVMREAASLSAQCGLELLDAIHCATAHVAGCAYIISEDRDMQGYSPVEVLSLDELETMA